ncbi:O-methyltransferase [Planococcus sp. FY231025]|uniref:O-methyltransferase n=1 Tax=Planococcus sp. FY231025 TaxID=3455699 RepID=UPI003F8FB519
MDQERLRETLGSIRRYAQEHHVPIMEEQGIRELVHLLEEQQPEGILEIGAAIGFSAIKMAEGLPDSRIDTIERDDSRFQKAVEFVRASGMSDRIRIFHGDALEFDLAQLAPAYDAIFIDAAKGQYERFFEKYEGLLAEGGIIYCDNMYMHGMAEGPLSDIPRRKRTMIRNLKAFREHMLDHPAYETVLLPVGDGIMVCRKKSQKK